MDHKKYKYTQIDGKLLQLFKQRKNKEKIIVLNVLNLILKWMYIYIWKKVVILHHWANSARFEVYIPFVFCTSRAIFSTFSPFIEKLSNLASIWVYLFFLWPIEVKKKIEKFRLFQNVWTSKFWCNFEDISSEDSILYKIK